MRSSLLLLTTIFASITDWLPALSVEDLQVSFQAAVLKANESRDKQIGTLDQRYTAALANLQEKAQKKADLEEALAIKNEGKLIAEKTWPLPPVPGEHAKILNRPRQTYLKTRLGIEREWALSMSNLADKMEEALEAQVTSLTKAGNLKEAQRAKELLEKIQKDPELAKARELPSRVTRSGRSRAGYLVRRNGDDLEVLVRYDSEGKISLKSPVENVVEQTGGKREKGKTNARTLGEFVGADAGFKESYVALNHTLEDGKLTPQEIYGVDISFQNDEGTVYEIRKGVKNAYLGFPNLLGTLSSPATYRISGELNIPKENKTLSGLFFRHGNSNGTVLGEQITSSGNWQTVTREGAGGSPLPLLRIHFTGFKLSDMKKVWGDRVVFKNLRVEFIKFSAHIVEKYGDSGEAMISEPDPSKQKLLVANGALVEDL
jgi:hypothetical protein